MEVLLFGDQTGATCDFLDEAFRQTQSNPLVEIFLQSAAACLRQQLTHLPRSERSRIPNFTTVQELLQSYQENGNGHPAIESSLLCISQFVHFLGFQGANQSAEVPRPETFVIGVCTGLLAAAAVASSSSLADLLPLSIEVVGIAFRLGRKVDEAARLLYPQTGKSESWSVVFNGINESTAQTALTGLNANLNIPKTSQAYISAVGPNTVTISGSPAVLKQIREAPGPLKKLASLSIPVHGPYHTSELYGQINLHDIIYGQSTAAREIISRYSPRSTILSSTTGNPLIAESTSRLFEHIVVEILTQPLRWDKILKGSVHVLRTLSAENVSILPVGPTNAGNSLSLAIKTETGIIPTVRDSAAWVTQTLGNGGLNSKKPNSSKIAIVGLAGRFPGAQDHEKLWELLESGLDVHREIPTDRFSAKHHVDAAGKERNTSHTPYGCFIDNPGSFDPRFFHMSPREAEQTDPMQRLALVTACEALEMAGFVPNRTESSMLDRVGTFYGQTSDDYREMNASQNVGTYFITGGIRAFGPGRINYHFKFSGPSFNIDTACSSSLAAIQVACTSLWSRECDTAVAGGLSVLTSPDLFAGLSRGQFLSKTGSCKTFDNDADGYCRGDSIGSVILKRLDDAVSDKDNILGVILGAATNHSADAISITHPHAETQSKLYKKILTQSGVDPLDVGYVEMHGTGTQAGDGAEMASVSSVFAPAARGREADNPLFVGATKSNIGHGEAASGVTALIKALMILQKSSIPPHVGIKGQLNHTFPNLDERKIKIALSKTPFIAKAGKPRRLLVNNFSAAGGNTALLIEEHTSPATQVIDPRPTHIVSVSAKSSFSLLKNTERLINYIDRNPHVNLASLSYTTTARRVHHELRRAVVGKSVQQIRDSLLASTSQAPSKPPRDAVKVSFVFTGQGAHYPSLGAQLFKSSIQFRSDVQLFDGLAQSQGFPSFLSLIDGSSDDIGHLSPVQLQVGLVSIQMALSHLWEAWGIKPDFVIGHSLGEYAALNAAGVLSPSDTISLVGQRARLLEEKCQPGTHSMLAIQGNAADIRQIIAKESWNAEIACINGPREVVLSGILSDIEMTRVELSKRGYKCTLLNVQFAFHSAQVEPILADFESRSQSITFSPATIPIISPLLGRILQKGEVNPEYLRRHAREPVDFSAALENGVRHGLLGDDTVWIELGPHPVCSGMIKATLNTGLTVTTLRRREDPWETVTRSVKSIYEHGLNIDWSEYHRDFHAAHQLLTLPSYAFEEKNYWLEYKNNWSLTKGDLIAPQNSEEAPRASFSTTTLQRILTEEYQEDSATVVFESDFSDRLLHAAVTGHLVNDSGLCPSSIYADMALTAANFIFERLKPSSQAPGMNVRAMDVSKPVIVSSSRGTVPHLIRITAKSDLSKSRTELEYSSVDPNTQIRAINAHCFVEYGDFAEWSSEWTRNAYLIQSRIKALESGADGGDVHRILRGMAYKLFAALVQYSDKYRGMEEVLLHSEQREAVANIAFQSTDKDGRFFLSPYWIDSIAHLSGFVVNANDAVDSKSHVFISHGWDSMRFTRELTAEKRYRSYVKMQPVPGSTVMSGDVYVFDGDEIVGLIGGLKFQQIPRTLLNHLLPPGGNSRTQVSKASAVPVTSPGKKYPDSVVTHPKTTKATRPSRMPEPFQVSNLAARVAQIIATEAGIAPGEVTDDLKFNELGIDSLLSLAIAGRLREELDLPCSSSIFIDHNTFGSLRGYLEEHEARRQGPVTPDTSAQTTYGANTPDSTNSSPPDLVDPSIWNDSSSDASSDEETPFEDTKGILKTIIAEEMGLDLDSVSPAAPLASLGMDSLMSLAVLGALRERTGLEISPSLLGNDPTVTDLQKRLRALTSPPEPSKPAPSPTADRLPTATSILLHSSTSSSPASTLFLLPDGSGSATSYSPLPPLSSPRTIYALNSPFLSNPSSYTCGLSRLATLYLTEIQRRQPRGPYNLAGWSAGGVLAFEIARQLIATNESVDKLVLIDAPCPLTLEPLPRSLVRFFNRIGLFGKGEAPKWLMEHFDASVKNLAKYKPVPIPSAASSSSSRDTGPRHVLALWARDGVCKSPDDPRPLPSDRADPSDPVEETASQRWILENRLEMGSGGWEGLLPGRKIEGRGVGGNHFTMMRTGNVEEVARILGEVMDR